MIPEGWTKKSLEGVAEIRTGLAKGKKTDEALVHRPYLRVANVQDGYLDLRVIKDIEVREKDVARYSLEVGDVVLTEGGDFDKLGRGAVWRGQVAGCLHQNHVFAVRTERSKLLPDFFAAQSASHYGKSYYLSCAKRSTNLASINSTQLRQFPVLIPPLQEQREITETLGTWDRAIETVEALIANARAQKQALMQQLLPQGTTPPKKRLPGFSGEWRETSLAELVSVKRAKGKIVPTNQDGDGVPYIGSTSFLGEFSNYTTSQDALLCIETDILVLWDGEYAGKVATGLTGAVSSTVGRYRLAKAKADPIFVVTLMEKASERIRSIREGSGIPHVPGDFEDWFKFAMPPLDEQQAIADVFRANLVATEALQSQLTTLRQEKAALMQQLLTGKRRVKLVREEEAC